MTEAPAIRRDGDSLLLRVKVRPGAKRDRILGVRGALLHVEVAAVAADGRATERLLHVLAERFGVARSRVELLSGAHSRWKRLRVVGGVLPAELAAAPDDDGGDDSDDGGGGAVRR